MPIPSPPRSRLFRLLMRLYPRAYRDRYAAEMEAFERQERASNGGGGLYWAHQLADHGQAAARIRRAERKGRMRGLFTDLWSGWRTLRRAPAFTIFAVTTLALGIGATTAVFSLLDRVVLRPLPYPASERMALVGSQIRIDPDSRGPLSPALMVALQESPGPAVEVVGGAMRDAVLGGEGDPERLSVARVTRGFFTFFGARAEIGRLLSVADHAAGAPKVAVIGDAFWRQRFAADPGAVGRTLRLDDDVYTIVGVLEADFVPPPEVIEADDVWVPMGLSDTEAARGGFYITGVARLPEGTGRDDMTTHMGRLVEQLYPPGDGPRFLLGGVVRDYRQEVVGTVGGTLGRVLAAVGLLLLIACVNVASLLLTRGAEREHEMSLRTALGAGRVRLVRQLLSESLLLALAGGALGSALAYAAVGTFRRHAPEGLPRLAEVTVDARGLAFALALGVVTVLLFGLLPALRSARRCLDHAESLARRGTTPSRREGRLRGALVAVETGLAVVLAVGSALLAHDLVRMATLDPGFRPDGVAALRVDLRSRYERGEWAGTWERFLEGARTLPGVSHAAVATQVPYTGDRIADTYRPEGVEGDAADGVFVITVTIGGDYLGTLGEELVDGRDFDAGDRDAPVILVNEAFVRQFWPGARGVGKEVRSGGDDEPTYRVVGVVADMVTRPGRPVAPRVYAQLSEQPEADMEVVARTDGDASQLAAALRDLARRIDPALPVTSVRTVEALGHEALARPRFYTTLFGSFAALALLLGVVGVYGTTAYAARSRTREIAIRLTLGASRPRVIARVVGRTGAAVAVGVVLGLIGAAAGSRAMTEVLHYVTPGDLVSYGTVALVVLACGLLAAWIPAARAGRVDPASALREQ